MHNGRSSLNDAQFYNRRYEHVLVLQLASLRDDQVNVDRNCCISANFAKFIVKEVTD